MTFLRFVGPLLLSASLSPLASPALAADGFGGASVPDAVLRGTLESMRDAGPVTLGGVPLESGRLLADFYAARDYRLAWERPSQVAALLRAVEQSSADGLNPADYDLPLLKRLAASQGLDSLKGAERLAADLQLSDVLLRYSYHLRFGRVDPVAVSRAWNHRAPVPAASLIGYMEQVVAAPDTAAALDSIAARQPFYYANLKRALREYGGSDPVRGLAPIPTGAKLVAGKRDSRVPLVREHLQALGDYQPAVAADPTIAAPADPEVFDQQLRVALIAFQRRFGLTADGVLTNSTVAALNQPVNGGKVEQIRMNLERMRWTYDDLPKDYVLVDVGGFMAHVVRGGRIDWSTRVVVGTPEQQTPSFRDEMEHVVFNPTWTVPPSIQKKMRGPGRFQVYHRRGARGGINDPGSVSLVQPAGPGNALGRVKFIFPNDEAVYLHDTQSKGLFSQTVRAFSHGCVRVQNPLKLAEVILGPAGWDQHQINRVVSTNRTRFVPLEQRLPVLLNYLTAAADEQGKVEFRRDIYGRDPALRRALNGPPSELRIGFAPAVPLVDPSSQVAGTSAGKSGGERVPVRPKEQAGTAVPTGEAAPASRATLTQVPGSAPKLDETRTLAPAVAAPAGSPARM